MEVAKELQSQQQELQKLLVERQQLETQLQESKIVKDEFDRLNDESRIFKMIGPVLVPQEKSEAEANVSKRLEFIESQIKQVEEKMTALQDSLIKKQQEFEATAMKSAQASQPQPGQPGQTSQPAQTA